MTEAEVSSRRRLPVIWLVPAVAVVLGIYMVIYTVMNEGPAITITFSTAQGIEAGRTKLSSRSVEVGLVEEVTLNEDLDSVSVVARLERENTSLLRDDTRFWVVRPRFGAGGISGLNTLLSGAYIELEPGSGAPSTRRDFVGLDDVPVTAVGTPGLGLVLVSKRAGVVSPGQPVLYNGFRVGRVESTTFETDTGSVRHGVFIEAPYDAFVNGATRFWDAGGIVVRTGAGGLLVDVESLQALLIGGVAFGVPKGVSPKGPVESGAEFVLHRDRQSATELSYEHSLEFVVLFTQSVRGLVPGAPVEYRGIRVGSVGPVLIAPVIEANLRGSTAQPIPVLISIEPGRLGLDDTAEGAEQMRQIIDRGARGRMRASLESANLLTGALLVAIDFYPEEEVGEIGTFAGYPTLPTISGGFERIERQVSALLEKLNDMLIEATVRELNRILDDLREVTGSDEFQELPAAVTAVLEDLQQDLQLISPDSPPYDRLYRTITELNRTLQSADGLLRTLDEKPNSIIFSKPAEPDPEPRRGRP